MPNDDQKPTGEPAGQCLIRCEAKPLSKLSEDARAIVWDQLEWHIEDAGNVAAVTPSPPAVENDIVYPAMPAHNDGFGRKTLSLRFKDRHEWTVDAELELRFNRDGTGAADEHHASLANVAAGNPNWYVYWQQVANQFSHPASGTFGPHTTMIYEDSAPEADEDGFRLMGTYSFDAVAPVAAYQIDSSRERIRVNKNCNASIVDFVKTIHHENGHRQSCRLPNSQGGWGANHTYYWRDDVEDETLWGAAADQLHKVFEEADPNCTPNEKNADYKEAREHGWDTVADAAAGKAAGNYTNPSGYDAATGKGICPRNEAHVMSNQSGINAKDWSYVQPAIP